MSLLQKLRILSAAAVLMVPLDGAASPQAHKESNQKEEDIAAEAFRAGQALYEKGEYLEAAREFEKAYRLAPHPSVLANIGYCYNKIGDYPRAVRAFRTYLESPNPQKQQSNEKIENYLAEMKPKVGELQVNCLPARCQVTVDGRSYGMAPTSILLRAGAHAVDIEPVDGGRKRQFNVDVPGGGELVLDVDLPLSHPPSAEQTQPSQVVQIDPIAPIDGRTTKLRAPFWVATGTTIAGLTATAVLVGVGYKTREDFFGSGSTDKDLKQRGESLVVGINVAAGVTAASAIAAVVFYFVDSREHAQDEDQHTDVRSRNKKANVRFSAGAFTGLRVEF